jgi:hypothetical protein
MFENTNIVIRAVKFQHSAGGFQRVRNLRRNSRPQGIIRRRFIEAPDQAGNPRIDNSL